MAMEGHDPRGPAPEGDTMQYALFIYEDEALYGPDKNGPAIQEIVAKHMAFNRELGDRIRCDL
jgi:hypothetical protein